MELGEALRTRRMVRSFAERPVPSQLLDSVLSAGTHAPSAGSTQGWDFVVLVEEAKRRLFWEMSTDRAWREAGGVAGEGVRRAPAIALPVADPSAYVERYALADKARSSLSRLPAREWPVPYWTVDTAFATMLVLLAAHDAGLGALFFRIHRNSEALLDRLGVPEGHEAIGAIAIGWPAPEDARSRRAERRRPFSEIVHREGWQAPGPRQTGSRGSRRARER